MDFSSKDGRTRDDLENNNGNGGEKKTAKSDVDSANDGGSAGKNEAAKTLKPASLGSLFRYADALDYVLMAIGALGAIAHGGAIPIFMRILGQTIDSFGSNVDDPELMIREVGKMGIIFVIIGAIIGISSWAEISFFMWSGERQVVRMRIKYLDSILNKNIGYFDTDIRASDIVHTMNADTITIQDILSAKFGNFIRYTVSFVSGFVVGFTIVWQLGLVVLAIVPPMVIIGVVQTTALSKHTSKSEDALAESGNVIEQALFQIKIVQSFTGESKVLKAYSSALRVVQRAGYKCGLAKGLGTGASTSITFLSYTLILWYAGRLVRDGKTNGGLAIATIFSILIGGMGLVNAFPCLVEITKGRVSAARIYQTIDHKQGTNKDEEVKGLELEAVTGHLELKDVDFTYPSRPDIPILQCFSLKIEALKSLALVGTSGSGKSTVISLIERFYDPNSGQVLLDGHDVRTLKLKFLRQQIGLVSQESALFGTTIRENILLGRPNATEAEVEEAAKNANAHYFISQLPNGYDSQVGEKGLQLSGGQKQRIAIARAMLKDPKILLLDEATSALDSESEKLVHEALDGFMADRTTLMIAHRLSTIRNANLVAVLQRGSILELGTHDELMANEHDGMYAKLIHMHEMTNGTSFMRPRRSSARASNACSSGRTSIGRSSISHRPSDFSTTEIKLALDKVALHEQASSYCRLARKSSPEWRISLLGLISSMACGALNILFIYIISAVLAVYYVKDHNYMESEILKYCYIMLGVSSLAFVFNTSKHLFWDVVGEKLTKRVREEMLEVILRNEIAWFDLEENATSSVSARLTSDAYYVRLVIADYTSIIVQNMTILSVACIIGLVLQWKFTLLLIAIFPIIGLEALMQKTVMKGFTGDIEAAHFKATQIAGEAVTNIKVVTSFNSQSDIINLFSEKLQDPLRNCFKKGQTVGISFSLAQLVLFSSYALSWWFASWLVKNNMATFSRCITVFIVMMISASSTTEPLTMMPDFIKGGRAVKSAFETIDRETKINPDDNPDVYLDLDSMRGEIELKHVDFSYPSDPDVLVLRDFSLRARAKKSLAIVGPSGSGKSTIISLVQRFYEPFCGCVLVDGNDIRKYNLKSLRKAMAMVPQEPLLFATTVYDNIAYGSENANETEVIEAAKVANADRFVSELPEGYQTILGERGVQLSGGQRQRIAIARAFLKKAPIMLLDEATSALDIESERSVHEALGRATKGRTTIIVAHRLSTIRNVDSIAVIDEGKVVEQGSNSHLMKNSPDGVYARMVKLQKLSSN